MSITCIPHPTAYGAKSSKAFSPNIRSLYETVDFKADAQTFNTFYRANRKAIYRNPEGVEFRCSTTARSSSRAPGKSSPTCCPARPRRARSRAATCCTAGFPASTFPQCPAAEEDHFVELVQQLAKGGLTVCIQTDGRNPPCSNASSA